MADCGDYKAPDNGICEAPMDFGPGQPLACGH